MKSIDLFCASSASTDTICSSMDQRAIVRPGMRRPVHRQIHRPKNRTNAGPCSSHLTFDPSTRPFLDVVSDSSQPLKKDDNYNYKLLNFIGLSGFRSFSTRTYVEYPVYKPSPTAADSAQALKNPSGKLSRRHLAAQKSSSTPTNRQVVELRVSIHCKACEGKLRKYISRMEGVTSFNIDLATKKVTVIGDVTPLGVLTSISKVKNAQFWPSTYTSSSSSLSKS